jgi:predicted nucleic acid-binding protein
MAGDGARLVLADASPLIGLAIVDGLRWIPELFGEVWVPQSVRGEVLPGIQARGEAEIAAAIKAKHLRVWTRVIPEVSPPLPDLDEGESDCIRIAASSELGRTLILMDERAGRAVATERGISVAGTAAVIGLAKKRKLIRAAKPVFAKLHATDFRIGVNVIETVLRDLNEL